MTRRNWFLKLFTTKSKSARKALQAGAPRRPSVRPRLETLEDRTVPTTWTVKPGGGGNFTTISAAVGSASVVNGDIVLVDPGTYSENVTVNKSLILEGNQHGVDARNPRGAETIVDGTANGGKTPFSITASNVTLDGFTVEGATNPNLVGFGIFLSPGTAGSHIVNDIVQNNIAGLSLANNSGSNATVVQHDLFSNNNQPGPGSGDAIYTDQFGAGGTLTNVWIDGNTFTGNSDAGLDFSSSDPTLPATAITISNNNFNANARGMLAFSLTSSAVTNNTFQNSNSSATADIRLFEGVNGLTLSGNLLENGAGRALRINNEGSFPALSNATNVTLVENSISGYTGPTDIVAVDPTGYTGTLNASGNWWGTAIGANPSDATAPTAIDGITSGGVHIGSFLDSSSNAAPGNGFTPGAATEMWVPKTAATSGLTRVSGVIQDGINTAVAGMTVRVAADTYAENVIINKALTLRGAQAGNNANTRFGTFTTGADGPKANPNVETVLTAPTNNPTGGNPNANDLIRVVANNITVDGLVLDGNNPTLDTTGTQLIAPNGVHIQARRGIQNSDANNNFFDINNLLLENNIIQNVAQRGVELSNNSTVSSGNLITGNAIRNFGSDPVNGGLGIILFTNAYADVTNNTIVDTVGAGLATGLQLQNFYSNGTMTWSGNNITVAQDDIGIIANLFYASTATLNINNNTVNAAAGVTPGSDLSWGVYVLSVQVGSTVSISGNTIGNSGGQFARGISLWNLPTSNTVTASGGTVGNSLVGIDLESVDPFFGAGAATAVNVNNVAITGGTTGVRVQAATVNAVNPTASVTANLAGVTVNGATTGVLVQGFSQSISTTATLFRDKITGATTGVQVNANGNLGTVAQDTAQNFITGNTMGIAIASGAGTIQPIFDNDLSGNTNAVANSSGTLVDFSANWWGSNSAATVATQAGANVDYTPFLNAGSDTDLGTAGFQGDFSFLDVTAGGPQVGGTGRIQEGVNLLANGNLTGGARTVNVLAGTYAESVAVNKALTLQGVVTTTVIDASGLVTGVHITASNVTVTNLKVQGNSLTGQGVWIDASGSSLTGDSATGTTITGVGTNIANDGIRADNGGTANTITGLTITGNTVSNIGASPGYGLFLNGVSGGTYSNNSFANLANDAAYPSVSNPTGVAVSTASIGVFVANSSGVTVDNTNSYSNLTLAGYFAPTTTGSTFSGAVANISDVGGYYVNGNSPSNTMSVTGLTQSVSTNNIAAGAGANFSPLGNVPNLFATIQTAIDFSAASATVTATAGLFQEHVIVYKTLTLQGANVDVAGSSGSRAAESEIRTNGNQSAIINVRANGVTIDGFYLEGDDPSGTGGTLASGADANALYGVLAGTASAANSVSAVTVQNSIIKDVFIGVRGDGPTSGTPVSGSVIANNWFDSIGNFDFGYAVTLRTNFYADVTSNLMTRVWTGVHTNNTFLAGGPATWTVSGNTIHSYAAGLWDNLQYQNATHLTFSGNQLAAETGAVANNIGVLLVSIQDTVGISFTNNTITGTDYGVMLWNTSTSSTITLGSTNSIVNPKKVGVYLTNNLAFNPIGTTTFGVTTASTSVVLDGLSITGVAAAGVGAEVQRDSSGGNDTLNIQNNATVSGGGTGVLVQGPRASASIQQSSITGSTTGVSVTAGGNLTGAAQNFITGHTTGINIASGAGTIGAVFDNDLSGNTTAIDNGTSTTVDASANWWGSNTRAAVQGGISGSVDYTPFLNSGTDTVLVTAGFQGDFSFLNVDIQSPQVGGTGRIQEAVNLLADGSLTGSNRVVNVLAGTYTENVTVASKLLTLQGAGAATTTLTGSGTGFTFTGTGAETDTLSGFTVQNSGQGLSASNLNTLNLSDISLSNTAAGNSSISSTTTANYSILAASASTTFTVNGNLFTRGSDKAIALSGLTNFNVTGGNAGDIYNISGATGSTNMTCNGGSGSDTFDITPSPASGGIVLTIHGNLPTTPPGDTLNINMLGVLGAMFSGGVPSGSLTSSNRATVSWDGIETLNQAVGMTAGQRFRVVRNGVNDEVQDITAGTPGPVSFSFVYAGAAPLVILGSSNNLVAIDFTGATDPIPAAGFTFNAGAGPGDSLEIWNGSFTNLGSTYTGATAGSVTPDALGTIGYTGVDSLSLGGSAATGPSYGAQTTTVANTTITLPGTASTATLANGSGSLLSLTSAGIFVATTFTNPTASLAFNRGTTSDSLAVSGPTNLTAVLTVGDSTHPFGSATITGPVSLSESTGNLSVFASAINLGGNVSSTGGTVQNISFTGPVTLTGGGSTITTGGSGSASFSSIVQDTTAGAQNLSVGAGSTGNITFTGTVGSVPLGNVTLTSGTNASFGSTVTLNGNYSQRASFTGTATLNGGMSVGGTFGVTGNTFDANGQANTVGGLATVSGGGTYKALTALQTFNGGLSVLNIGSSVTGTNGQVAVNGLLTLDSSTIALGSGTLFQSGDVTSTASTTPATITAGTMDLGGFSRTFTVPLGPASPADLLVNAAVTDGGVTKTGGGVLLLAGINTYTGPTNVNGGILTVNGVINNNAVATAGIVQLNTAGVLLNGTGLIKGQVTVFASTFASKSQVQNVTVAVPSSGTGITVPGGVVFVQIGTLHGVTISGGGVTSTGILVSGSALIENSMILTQNVDVNVNAGVAALQGDTLTPGSGSYITGLLVKGGAIVDAGQLSASYTPLPNGPPNNVGYYGDITGLFNTATGMPLQPGITPSSGNNTFGTNSAPFSLDTSMNASLNPGPTGSQAIRDENTGVASLSALPNGVEQPLGGPFNYGAAGPQLGRLDVTAQSNLWNGSATLPTFQIEQLVFHDIDDNSVGFVSYGNGATATAPTVTTTPLYAASTNPALNPTQAGQGTLVTGASQGAEQMSAIRALQVTFSSYVFLDPNLLSATSNRGINLLQLNSPYGPAGSGAGAVPQLIRVTVFSTSYNRTTGAYTVVFTWNNAAGTEYGSLQDGNYSLNFNASAIQGGGPGGPGLTGTYSSAGTYTALFHRVFGDVNNDFRTDNTDLAAFQAALRSRVGMTTYRAYFDFDNNGVVDTGDYNMFLRRYKTMLNPDGTVTIIP